MKSAFVLCLILVAASTQAKLPLPDKAGVAKTIQGLMWGLLQERGFDDVQHCIKDSLTIAKELRTAVADFKEKSFDGVKNGFLEMGLAIQEIVVALDDCKDIKADLSRIIQYAEVFKHPKSLAYQIGMDLLLNGQEIYAEITKQVDDFEHKDYFNFGVDAGEVLGLLLPPENQDVSVAYKTRSERFTYDLLAGYLDVVEPSYSRQALYNSVNGMGKKVFDTVSFHLGENRDRVAFPETLKKVFDESNRAMMYAAAELEQSNAFYGDELTNIAKGMGCHKIHEEPDFETLDKMIEAHKMSKIREMGQHYARFTFGACYAL